MESHLPLSQKHWDAEPPGIVGPRLWSQTQPQHVGTFKGAAAGASRTAAVRLMESLHSRLRRLWDQEHGTISADESLAVHQAIVDDKRTRLSALLPRHS